MDFKSGPSQYLLRYLSISPFFMNKGLVEHIILPLLRVWF